jgi:Selenocysteine lyase
MLPNLNLAGLKGALEYLLELGRTQASRIIPSSNRKLFRLALEAIKRYERDLSLYFLERWKRLGPGRGQLYGITQEESIVYRTPTFALEIPGFRADQLKKALWEQSRILIADGTHYSAVVVRHLRKEGLNRVSLAHYDGPETIDAFFDALEKIVLK